MKNVFVFVLFFLTLLYPAQITGEKQIDSLLDKSDDLFSEAKFSQAFQMANKGLQFSKKIKYSKGIVFANINIAGILLETGAYARSLTHLDDAEKEPYFKKDFFFEYEFYRIRGRIRDNLEMNNMALKDYQKSLSVAYQIATPNRKRLSVFYAHQNLLQSFEGFKQTDSVWHHLSVMEKELKGFDFDKKRYISNYIYTYTKIAEKLIEQKQFKKAENYLSNSLALCKTNEFPLEFDIWEMYGNLEVAKENTDKAAEYYRMAFENAYHHECLDQARYLSGVLADLYSKKNLDPAIANKYLYLHNNLRDSLDTVNKHVVEKVIGQVLHEEKREQKEKESFYIQILGGIVILIIVAGGYFYFRIKKNRQLLKRNTLDLFEKNALAEALGKKVEENKFNDLVVLAKNNNPEFLTLFSELYPDFIQKLKNFDPKIRSSELSFCAMAYLNFSAKDIATYTYVTLGAVEMRRSRLRKKYNIPSEIDFNNWMRREY